MGIAASTGGIQALKDLLAVLPRDFPCPIVVVQHLGPASQYKSVLDAIVAFRTVLKVKWAEDGEALKAGCVFVAPQDRHVEIDSDRKIRLLTSGKVNGSRPAADPLFTSIAREYGERGAAAILSGALYDGAEGAYKIAAAKGRVFAQARETAQCAEMPEAAIRTGAVHFELSPEMIARALIALAMAPGAAAWLRVWPKTLTRPLRTPPSHSLRWYDLPV